MLLGVLGFHQIFYALIDFGEKFFNFSDYPFLFFKGGNGNVMAFKI